MPCSDMYAMDHPSSVEYRDNPEIKKRLDKATRLLCSSLHNIRKLDVTIYRALLREDKELATWWNQHQKEDAIRERKEREAKRRMAVKQIALNKLTEEEKKLLGL